MSLNRRDLMFAAAAAAAGALGVCPAMAGTQVLGGRAFGSTWRVVTADPQAGAIMAAVEAIIAEVDGAMSPYRAGSELSRFNRSDSLDWQPASAALCGVVGASLQVGEATGGAFDPTVGPLVHRFGFGPISGDRGGPGGLDIGDGALRKAAPGLTIDLCGIAKGYALDRMVGALGDLGARDALIELGGEVRVLGRHPDGRDWQVGIERPGSVREEFQRVIAPRGMALATSGTGWQGYRDGDRRVSHLIDPRRGAPVANALVSVSVLAPGGMQADALATAMMVLGSEAGPALAEQLNVPALFLTDAADGGTEIMTGGFADHVLA